MPDKGDKDRHDLRFALARNPAFQKAIEARKARAEFPRRMLESIEEIRGSKGERQERLAGEFERKYGFPPSRMRQVVLEETLPVCFENDEQECARTYRFVEERLRRAMSRPPEQELVVMTTSYLLEMVENEASAIMLDRLLCGSDMDYSDQVARETEAEGIFTAPNTLNIYQTLGRLEVAAIAMEEACRALGPVLEDGIEAGLPQPVVLTLFKCERVREAENVAGQLGQSLKLRYLYEDFLGRLAANIGGEQRAFMAASVAGSAGSGELVTITFGSKVVGVHMREALDWAITLSFSFLKNFELPGKRRLALETISHMVDLLPAISTASYELEGTLKPDADTIIRRVQHAIDECRGNIDTAAFHITSRDGNGAGRELAGLTARGAEDYNRTLNDFVMAKFSRGQKVWQLYAKQLFLLSGEARERFIEVARERGEWLVAGRLGVVPLASLNLILTHGQVDEAMAGFIRRFEPKWGFKRYGSSGACVLYVSEHEMEGAVQRLIEQGRGIGGDAGIRPFLLLSRVASESVTTLHQDITSARNALKLARLLAAACGEASEFGPMRDGGVFVADRDISRIVGLTTEPPNIPIYLARLSNYARRYRKTERRLAGIEKLRTYAGEAAPPVEDQNIREFVLATYNAHRITLIDELKRPRRRWDPQWQDSCTPQNEWTGNSDPYETMAIIYGALARNHGVDITAVLDGRAPGREFYSIMDAAREAFAAGGLEIGPFIKELWKFELSLMQAADIALFREQKKK